MNSGLEYTASNECMRWNGFRRKRPWLDKGTLVTFACKVWRRAQKTCLDSQCLGRDSKRTLPKYELKALPLRHPNPFFLFHSSICKPWTVMTPRDNFLLSPNFEPCRPTYLAGIRQRLQRLATGRIAVAHPASYPTGSRGSSSVVKEVGVWHRNPPPQIYYQGKALDLPSPNVCMAWWFIMRSGNFNFSAILQGGPDHIRQFLIINNQSIQQHTGKWESTFCCR
jgi:hypothetical protein